MAGLNINSCTTRQLIGLPGISRSLAESIIKLRESQHGIQTVDELLSLPGMTRSKCRLLARKFSISSRPLVLGVTNRKSYSKVTVARTNFMCEGQSVGNKNAELLVPKSSLAGLSSPAYVKKRASCQNHPTLYTDYPYYEKQISTNLRNKKVNLYPTLKPYVLQAERANMNQREERFKDRPHEDVWDRDKRYDHFVQDEHVENPSDSTRQPAVTFQASASGNNINFSCTFDRRILSNSAPAQTQQAQKWTLIHPEEFMGTTNHEKNEKRPPSEGIGSSKSSSENDVVAAEPEVNVSAARLYQHQRQPSPPPPSTSTKSTDTSSTPPGILCMLSVENLLLFDRQKRVTVAEKQKYINSWVTEVNKFREHSSINPRKPEARHIPIVQPYYIPRCSGTTPDRSPLYARRRGRYRVEDVGNMPQILTSPDNAENCRNRASSGDTWTAPSPGKNRTDSEQVEDYVNQGCEGANANEDMKSEKDNNQRQIKIIIENKKMLQKRKVKSGNMYERTPAQLKPGVKVVLDPKFKTHTKQLKKLINNYVLPHPRKKKI